MNRNHSPLKGRDLDGYILGELLQEEPGMVLYAASQADGSRTNLAARILRKTDAQTTKAFERELQMLKSFEHPGILTLRHQGQLQPESLRYLITDFPAGALTLKDYCDQHRLTIRKRIVLLRDLCAVVSFAHRNFVLHRQITAESIYVDPQGQVYLSGFELSRIFEPANPQGTPTQMNQSTLAATSCISPEQYRGEKLMTASDIYSLGVVFYELLSGYVAHPADSSTEAFEESLLDLMPDAPSRRVRQAMAQKDTKLKTLAACRSTSVRALIGQLNELDELVLKAMEKKPQDRYQTAMECFVLFQDYLEHRPLPGVSKPLYRTRTACRAHPWRVILTLVSLLSLIGWTVGMTVQKQQMQAQAQRSQAVTSFLTGLFDRQEAGPMRGPIRLLLDKGRDRLDTGLVTQPQIAARLHQVITRSYHGLGHYPEAIHMWREAVTQLREKEGREASRLAEYQLMLALSLLGFGSANDAAIELYQARELVKEEGEEHPFYVAIENALMIALREMGDYEQVDRELKKGMALYRQGKKKDSYYLGLLQQQIAMLQLRGHYESALPFVLEALTFARAFHGPASRQTASFLDHLGSIKMQLGYEEEALDAFSEVAAILEATVGEKHPTYYIFIGSMAHLMLRLGHIEEARKLERQVQEFSGEAFSSLSTWHVSRAITQNTPLYEDDGQPPLAMKEAHQLMKRLERKGGLKGRVIHFFEIIADMYRDRNSEQHLSELEDLLHFLHTRVPELTEFLFYVEQMYSLVLLQHGRFQEAEEHLACAQAEMTRLPYVMDTYRLQHESISFLLYLSWNKQERARFNGARFIDTFLAMEDRFQKVYQGITAGP